MDTSLRVLERTLCRVFPAYFLEHYVRIESPESGDWVPFHLWPQQQLALETLQHNRSVVILKARQLGLTWLSLSFALWLMVTQPPAVILLFSLREAEAVELLRRLRAMHDRLPAWLQHGAGPTTTATRWELASGSRAHAFSTQSGRSYTGTLALVDEADFVPNLATFLNAVKPTVDAGGRLLLVSTSDKAQPLSPFKRIYRAAAAGACGEGVNARDRSTYAPLFLPWYARPDRTPAWRARVAAEMFAQRGSHDDFFQEYPATADEALRVRSLAARLPAAWLERITVAQPPLPAATLPPALAGLAGLAIFARPVAGNRYVAAADPAEGNPRSDESALTLLDAFTGAQVAILAGPIAPDLFALHAAALCRWYGDAPILVERNNHGHAVLGWLAEQGVELLSGPDGRPGWLTTAASKTRAWDEAARRISSEGCSIADGETAAQLALVEATTLRAPTGHHDDRAMAFVLGLAALGSAAPIPTPPVAPADPLPRLRRPRLRLMRTCDAKAQVYVVREMARGCYNGAAALRICAAPFPADRTFRCSSCSRPNIYKFCAASAR